MLINNFKVLKVSLPEHKPVNANLEFRIIKIRIRSKCTQLTLVKILNNQHGLPFKISRLKIITLFTIKRSAAFTLQIFCTNSGYVAQ